MTVRARSAALWERFPSEISKTIGWSRKDWACGQRSEAGKSLPSEVKFHKSLASLQFMNSLIKSRNEMPFPPPLLNLGLVIGRMAWLLFTVLKGVVLLVPKMPTTLLLLGGGANKTEKVDATTNLSRDWRRQ
jgi:hypothetical protein